MTDQRYDVVVVGGGFAGVAAARDLTDDGYSVLLLEARDRLGGRTWARDFEGTDVMVELGGQWFSPTYNTLVQEEVERYGIEVDYSPKRETEVTLAAGKRYDGPVPTEIESLMELERAWVHFINCASRVQPGVPYDLQPIADLDVSWRAFIDPLELSAPMRDFVDSWVALFTGRRPDDVSALYFLNKINFLNRSVLAFATVLDARFKHGTKSLIEAMAGDSSAEVRYETPVASVEQDDDGVTVTTEAGETVRARCVVVAMPVNCWNDVDFTPAISDVKRTVSGEVHAAPTAKVWALVQDAPDVFASMGSPAMGGGIHTVQSEYFVEGADGGQLMASFSYDPAINAQDASQIQESLQAYMPGCRVVRVDSHDWDADPYSKGGVISWKPGTLTKHISELQRPEGRVFFATADIATPFTGWIDGAIRTGRLCAARAGQLMAQAREKAAT